MKQYIKEYELEKQLFNEIGRNFRKNKTLSDEEFFKIIIWKSNRVKGKVLAGIKKSNKSVKQIMREVYNANTSEEKIKLLTNIKGIGLPIASAILTVCYPKKFTILDYRVWDILFKDKKVKGKNPSKTISEYLDYVDICKNYAKKLKLSLRDFDRTMWGRSFYEDLRNFLRKLKE